MHTFKLILIVLLAIILYSCGTTQLSIPPRPLNKGEYEIRYGIGLSLNEFNNFALQANIFWGVSDQDIVGLSFSNSLIPCHFAYAHYWMDKFQNYGSNFQFHIGNLFGLEFNPTFEADLAFSNYFKEMSQSFKIGLGYYYHPFQIKKYDYEELNTFIPVFGYLLQINSIEFETSLYYGLTKHYIDYYNPKPKISKNLPYDSYIISNDKILNIVDTTNYKGKEWLIKLKDSSIITISEYDPYPDCIACGYERKQKSKYNIDSNSNIYWFNNQYIELNLTKILNDYYSGKDLIIKIDQDQIDKKKQKVREFLDDINFGIGYIERKK